VDVVSRPIAYCEQHGESKTQTIDESMVNWKRSPHPHKKIASKFCGRIPTNLLSIDENKPLQSKN
jgi:hypothetical protein